jgi:hypothetical protein
MEVDMRIYGGGIEYNTDYEKIKSFIRNLLSSQQQEIKKRIGLMKKKQYCGWNHDDEGIEKDVCQECIAVNLALSDILNSL